MQKYCLHCGRVSGGAGDFCSLKCAELVQRFNRYVNSKLNEKALFQQAVQKQKRYDNEISKAYVSNFIKKAKLPSRVFLGDLHLPFENKYALDFAIELVREYNVAPEHVYSVGDFWDLYWFSRHEKSANADGNAIGELRDALYKSKEWVKKFPMMKMSIGNHDLRLLRKGSEAGIPAEAIKTLHQIFELPPTWQIEKDFLIFGEHSPFFMFHGEGFPDAIQAALYHGVNTIMGHLHTKAGISFMKTANQELWGANTSCLVQSETYAFEYGEKSKLKNILGSVLVHNGGEYAEWRPL
jgi:hypothetical protein